MASIVLNCPNCRQPYQMSPAQISKYAGRTITCRKCKQPFAFDDAMDAAARAAGQEEQVDEGTGDPSAGYGEAPQQEAAPQEESDSGAEEGQAAYAAGPADPVPVAVAPPPPPPPRRPVPKAPQSATSYPPPPAQAPPPPPAFAAPQMAAPPAPAYPPPAFAPPPVSSVGYAPAAERGGIGNLFGFQHMALPAMLPLVFWTGVAYCFFNGLRQLLELVLMTRYDRVVTTISGMRSMPSTSISFEGLSDRLMSIHGLYTVLDALFWFILGPLFFRGFCDLILAASRLLAADRK